MTDVLPSFSSLRSRNLRTLYGDEDDDIVGGNKRSTVAIDKSPKGSVDEGIRPLVDLINSHPDYVTLSSCSGRVALFDPGEDADIVVDENDDVGDDYDDDDDDDDEYGNDISGGGGGSIGVVGGGGSGKGRGGKWIFVTHDALSDLADRVMESLERIGRERYSSAPSAPSAPRWTRSHPPRQRHLRIPLTFKHEPPLLHVAACNLESGRRLLRICKGECAMRESGLVVTNTRVTVEVRTNSTSLCLPVWVDVRVDDTCRRRDDVGNNDEEECDDDDQKRIVVKISPDENYIRMLSDMVNERMKRNGDMIERLLRNVRVGLAFPPHRDDDDNDNDNDDDDDAPSNSTRMTHDEEDDGDADCHGDKGDEGTKQKQEGGSGGRGIMTTEGENDGGGESGVFKYRVTLRRSLPPLNLWKTAAVAVRWGGSCRSRNDQVVEDDADIDVDVLAFGGQGIGPVLPSSSATRVDHVDDDYVPASTSTTGVSMLCCRRQDEVYRLKRRGGAWSDRWETLSRISTPTMITEGISIADVSFLEANAGSSLALDDNVIVVNTTAGKFRVRVSNEGMGKREGHAAVVVPPTSSPRRIYVDKEDKVGLALDAVLIFGGRTTTTMNGEGGVRRSLLPSNDMFIFVLVPYSSPLSSNAAILSSKNKHMEDATDRRWTEDEDVVGLFGTPLDVRGTPPEPRFGHTMTVLSENNEGHRGRPFAVVAGGTGLNRSLSTPRDDIHAYQPSISLASIYTLSCIAPDGGGGGDCGGSKFSHFVWNRVADMPDPRSYHTSVALGGSFGDRDLFVFGGYDDAHDPFTSPYESSSSPSWFKAPLRICGEASIDVVDDTVPDHTNPVSNIEIDGEMLLPARIGSSALALTLTSRIPFVLVVGGTKFTSTSALASYSCDLDDEDDGKVPPLVLLALQRNKQNQPFKLTRIQSPELEVINMCDSVSGVGGYDAVDFGACVHHCVIALPRRRDDGDDDGESTEAKPPTADDDYPPQTIVIVGGGVPSLSFGQLYARSYILDVSRADTSNFAREKSSKHHKFTHLSQCHTSKISARHPTAATTTTEVDVIYVNAQNAKEAKDALELLGVLNKRYKMVKVNHHDHRNDYNLIAIPVTERFSDRYFLDTVREVNCASRLKQIIVKRGIETVPFSSSSMGRMKQKR